MAKFPIGCENSSHKSIDYFYSPELVSHLPNPPRLRGTRLDTKVLGSQPIATNHFSAMEFIWKPSWIFSKNKSERADYVSLVGIFLSLERAGESEMDIIHNMYKKNIINLKPMKTALKKSNKGGFTQKKYH